MLAHGWHFNKADPGAAMDQVDWIHRLADDPNTNDATLNVVFCNTSNSPACDKPSVHADTLAGRQHALTLFYQMQPDAFLKMKKEAEAKGMATTTTTTTTTKLSEKALVTIYTGAAYQVTMTQATIDSGTNYTAAELSRKPKTK